MFPYIFIILILLFGAITEVFGKMKQTKFYFVISAILVALFAGLRYNTGADWAIYESAFYQIPKFGNIVHWEIGYYWINLIFYQLFGNYYALQFAASVFLLYSVSRFLWKHTEYPIFSLLIFFIMFINNGILMAQVRQSIAIAIIIFGYEHIINRSLGKFLCVVMLACMFHISAIVALPMYLMTKRVPNFVLIISILVFQVFYFFPGIITGVIKIFLPYMPERLEDIGNAYLTHFYYAKKVKFNTGTYYLANVLLSTIVISFIKNNSKERSFLLNALTIAIIIGTLSNAISILGRFMSYYLVFAIATYPLIFNLKISKIAQKSSSLVMMLLLSVFFYVPLHTRLTSTTIDNVTDLPTNHSWNPYYNLISHPKKAETRVDRISHKN